MRRVMIVGAGGGIGLAMLDTLAGRSETEHLCAVHRRPVSSTSPRVHWLEAALGDTGDICNAAADMVQDGGLDGVVIATGVLHDGQLQPEKSLRDLSAGALTESYLVNAAGPLLLTAALKPFLRQAKTSFVCLLSAQIGSIGDNRLGGWYGYRMAKAALNMGVRTAAIEFERERMATRLFAVHPGTTRTSLSTPFIQRRRSPVSAPRETAARILRLLDQPDAIGNGSFVSADGKRLPW